MLASGEAVSFETTDLDGNPIDSEDIFGANKITMVNLWTSWCDPCVGNCPNWKS